MDRDEVMYLYGLSLKVLFAVTGCLQDSQEC